MKNRTFLYILCFLAFCLFLHFDASAQCVVCKNAAEQGAENGQTHTATLNSGILYLLAMPYVSIGVIGFLWWKNWKKKRAGETPVE